MRNFLVLALCLLPGALIFSSPAQQVRDSGGPPVAGTAVIAGTIAADDISRQPIRRAIVTLGGGARGGAGRGARVTVSDGTGAFQFAGLPAGRYTISASKPGWIATAYGATRSARAGVTINLAEGQRLTSIAMKMTHGAAITGVLSGDGGYLPQNAQIRAFPVRTIDGERHVTGQIGTATYDERGVYRLYGLPAGDYLIGALLPTMGVDLRVATEEELLWAQQLLKRPPAASPTAAAVAPASADDPAPPALGGRVGYAPVYYPGTLDPAQADLVTVRAGEERHGVDFPLRLLPMATLKVTVSDPSGRAVPDAQVSLSRVSLLAETAVSGYSQTQVQNGVVFSDVSVGDYKLFAQAIVRTSESASAPPSAPLALWASADIHVDGQDVDQALRLQPGMTVSGRLTFADGTPPGTVERGSVGVWPVAAGRAGPGGFPAGTVNSDGTFVITGVTPGRYTLRANNVGPGAQAWSLQAVIVGDRDMTDVGFDVLPGQNLSGVQVALTSLSTELSGTLIDAAGKPTADDYIVIFATNKTVWRSTSRWIARARPDTDGKWRVVGLPPGEYFVCALDDLDPNDLADASFLEQLAAAAFKITLGAGEKKTQDLKIGGGSVTS